MRLIRQNESGHGLRLILRGVILASACAALPLIAQETNAPTQLKPTVVTGTYLESADAAGTLTVTPMDLTEPINQGYSTVHDVLRTKLPQYGGPGNLNPSYGNGGDGNSYVSLRGLPGSATLLLVNGRRTSFSAVNLIPDAAVEKIEILNDGGSSVYGSDAVAGVVNVILKQNYNGTKISAEYGWTPDSPNVNERKFQLLTGSANDKASMVFSSEYSASDQLLSPDRKPSDQARGTSGTRNPGVQVSKEQFPTLTNALTGDIYPSALPLTWYVNPAVSRGLTNASQIPAGFNPLAFVDTSMATNSAQAGSMRDAAVAAANAALGPNSPVLYGAGPRFAYPAYTTLYRPHEKYDFSGTGTYKLIGEETVQLFADAYYVNYQSSSQLAPSPLTGLTIPGQNYWVTNVFPGTPATSSMSQNYRIVELGPRIYNETFEDFRFVGGLKGRIPDSTWKWEGAYMYTRGFNLQEASGGVVLSKLDELMGRTDPSAWNPFGYTPPFGQSVVNDVSALADKAYVQQISVVQGFDLTSGGKVVDLPGGELSVALGMAQRNEAYDFLPDLATKDGLIAPFNTLQPYSADRNIWGGFGEILVPILGKDFNLPGANELVVSAAGRYEDYDDVGDTGVKPRVSGRWKPLEKVEFNVKGSWAQGFSAPTFGQMYQPPGQDFVEVFNPYTQVYEQPVEAVLTSGNPNLKPTDSDTFLVGGEYAPSFIKGFMIGASYYKIKQDGVPFDSADYSVQQWYDAGGYSNPNNPWGANATKSSINPAGTQVEYDIANNQLYQVRNQSPINAGNRKTDGIDFSMSQYFDTSVGRFTVSGLATWVLSFEQQDVAGAPSVDYLGRYWGSGAALSDTGYPEWRANLTVSWDYKRWTAALGWNFCDGYTESYEDVDREVEPYQTFDIRLGYRIPKIEVEFMVGVNNLFDQTPSAVYSSFENNFDRSIGDPRGRMVIISASKEF
jgi:iron complex outermembrane receptor protein